MASTVPETGGNVGGKQDAATVLCEDSLSLDPHYLDVYGTLAALLNISCGSPAVNEQRTGSVVQRDKCTRLRIEGLAGRMSASSAASAEAAELATSAATAAPAAAAAAWLLRTAAALRRTGEDDSSAEAVFRAAEAKQAPSRQARLCMLRRLARRASEQQPLRLQLLLHRRRPWLRPGFGTPF